MSEVLDASKERMFASIVPDSGAKALSRYTEMVDDIIRTQAEKLQQGSELARVSLKEMDLPDSILALEGYFVLPSPLWEDVEAVQISCGPAGLDGELQKLRDLRRVNHEFLVQTEELLQKEAAEDTQFRSQFGTLHHDRIALRGFDRGRLRLSQSIPARPILDMPSKSTTHPLDQMKHLYARHDTFV